MTEFLIYAPPTLAFIGITGMLIEVFRGMVNFSIESNNPPISFEGNADTVEAEDAGEFPTEREGNLPQTIGDEVLARVGIVVATSCLLPCICPECGRSCECGKAHIYFSHRNEVCGSCLKQEVTHGN